MQTFSALGLISNHLRPHSSPNSGRGVSGGKCDGVVTYCLDKHSAYPEDNKGLPASLFHAIENCDFIVTR